MDWRPKCEKHTWKIFRKKYRRLCCFWERFLFCFFELNTYNIKFTILTTYSVQFRDIHVIMPPLLLVFRSRITLATSCEELTHWKRLWCWEGLGAGGEGDHRGWDGWMASLTLWTWVWVNSGSWWCTGRPGMLRFMVLQRVRHNWATELNWTIFSNRTRVSYVSYVGRQVLFH